MTEYKVNGHSIIIEDSIDELCIVRDHKFNVFLMIDANAGSDAQDFHRHTREMGELLRRGDMNEAKIKNATMEVNLTHIIQGLNYKHLALAAMVTEIDGVKYDATETGINAALEKLKSIGVKRGFINRVIDEVKKKMDQDEENTFGLQDSGELREYFTRLIQRTEVVLKKIIGVEVSENLIKEIDEFFYLLMKPKIFWGQKGVVNKYDLAFEKTCVIMNQYIPKDPKKLSVKEWKLTLIELNDQNKKMKKK